MAKRDRIDESEEVVRAAMYPYWDANLKRATPSAFTETEVSVSRLAILDFAQICLIFKKDFNGRAPLVSGESRLLTRLERELNND